MADVVNRLDGLNLEAGLARHLKALAALMTVPLIRVANSYPTLSAHDLHDSGDFGGKLECGWPLHAAGLSGMVGNALVEGNHDTVQIELRVVVG